MPINASEFKIINTIRRLKTADRNALDTFSGLSYPTIAAALNKNQDVIDRIKFNEEKKMSINEDFAYYIGISVGKEIKIVILDFAFEPYMNAEITDCYNNIFKDEDKQKIKIINEKGICLNFSHEEADDFSPLLTILNNMIEELLKTKSIGNKIRGIGFAFVGIVDCYETKVVSCLPGGHFNNLTLDKLLRPTLLQNLREKDITIIFEHMSKASTVSEKEKSPDCLTGEKNMACLYIGAGIGAGFIFNNKLYRGQNNASGQIGHIKIKLLEKSDEKEEDKCYCKQYNCIEKVVCNFFEEIKKFEEDEGKDHKDEINERIIKLSDYIAFLISQILNTLSLDTIIISGKLSFYLDDMWPHLISKYKFYCYDDLQSLCLIRKSNMREYAPSIGAAICAYFKENNAEIEW